MSSVSTPSGTTRSASRGLRTTPYRTWAWSFSPSRLSECGRCTCKRVGPRLRQLCEQRDVAFSFVDLRWGITEEESLAGKVASLCLAEIESCAPYFIGLLADRYGWVPSTLPPDLIAEQPWVRDYTGRSVTEVEIAAGALRKPTLSNSSLSSCKSRKVEETNTLSSRRSRPSFSARGMLEAIVTTSGRGRVRFRVSRQRRSQGNTARHTETHATGWCQRTTHARESQQDRLQDAERLGDEPRALFASVSIAWLGGSLNLLNGFILEETLDVGDSVCVSRSIRLMH